MTSEKQTDISVTLQNLAFGSDGKANITVPSGYVPVCVLIDPNWFATIHPVSDGTYFVIGHKADSPTTFLTDYTYANRKVICAKSSV